MAYIDATYVDQLVGGTALRTALFTDSGTYDSSAFTEALDTASDMVDAALNECGYPTGLTGTIPRVVKAATFGAFVRVAYTRKLEFDSYPEGLAYYVGLWDKLQAGQLRIPSLIQDTVEGIGGFVFSDNDESLTGSTPQIFSRTNLRGY